MADNYPQLQRTEFVQPARRISLPESTSSRLWQGMAQASAQLSDALDREVMALDARALASFQNDIDAKAIELRDSNAFKPSGFKSAWDDYTLSKMVSLPGRIQQDAKNIMADRGNNVMSQITSEKRAQDRALAIDTINTRYDNVRNEMLAEAYKNGTGTPVFMDLMKQARAVSDSGVGLGLKSTEASDFEFQDLIDKANGESVLGSIEKVYRANGEQAALERLEGFARDPSINMGQAERESLLARGASSISSMAAQDKKIVEQRNAEYTAGLDLRLEKALIDENTKALSDIYAEIETAAHLTPSGRTDRLVKVLKGQEEIAGSAGDFARVSAQLKGIPLIDPTEADDIKAVDKYFEKQFLPSLAETDPAGQIGQTLEFVRKTQVVPTAMKKQLVGGLASGAPEVKAVMAGQIVQLVEEVPFTQRSFNEQVIERAYQISDLMQAGMASDPEEAVRQAEEAAKVSPELVKMRDAQARAEKHFENNSAFLSKKSSVMGFFNDVDVPDGMLAEYNDIQSRIFRRTGSLEASQKAAWAQLSGVWGVTEIGMGGKRWSKYAPEAYGFPGENNSKWMKEQLFHDVMTENLFTPDTKLDKRVQLIPDNRTAREAGAGKTPSWPVWITDDSGVLVPLLSPQGVARRWTPDYKATDFYQKKAAENEELSNMNILEMRRAYKERQEMMLDDSANLWTGMGGIRP